MPPKAKNVTTCKSITQNRREHSVCTFPGLEKSALNQISSVQMLLTLLMCAKFFTHVVSNLSITLHSIHIIQIRILSLKDLKILELKIILKKISKYLESNENVLFVKICEA